MASFLERVSLLASAPAAAAAHAYNPAPPDIWMEITHVLFQLGASTVVFLLAIIVCFSENLRMEKEMVISFVRPVSQLALVGLVLHFIFAQKNVLWVLMTYLFTVIVGAYTAGQRAKHVPHSAYVAGAAIFVGTSVTMALLLILRVFPLKPSYMIPVAGLVVGRAMTVTGITLNRLRDDLRLQQNLVDKNKKMARLNIPGYIEK